ncbi:MAG: aminoacyl-tRNA hydrolase [Bacteriovoracia bacterium]
MKLLVGLGNPGREYEENRHNVGFMAIDYFAQSKNAVWKKWKDSQIAIEQESHILLKPQTYMNLSGKAVVQAAHFYKILPEEICVVYDDLDIPFGQVRLRQDGGPGGHNGIKSISQSLGFSSYYRVRVGIGRPVHPDHDPADYVLEDFSKEENKLLETIFDSCSKALDAFLTGPREFQLVMNKLNQRK